MYVNNIILYLFIMQFLLQASGRSLDCTFDEDLCGWNQEDTDQFNWTREYGKTTSRHTGPNADHKWDGWLEGSYIYIEASDPRKYGDKARLTSPIQESGQHCFVFWYSMYGSGIGTLNVYMVPNNTVIFTKSGDIGDLKWRSAAKYYTAPSEYQIVIEGIRGKNTKGDIGVDDVSMTPGMCAGCSFDSGLCLWKQDNADDFDWTLEKGATLSTGTGPKGDHTSGHGYYIYIETSEADKNQKARVASPLQNSGKYCLSFWYYMYGLHVDVLRVFIVDELEKTETEIDIISGSQGDKWIERNTYIHSTMRFWIIIEGKVGNRRRNNLGDIAVDDIVMLQCQECGDPTPKQGGVNSTHIYCGSVIEITCNVGYNINGSSVISCQADGTWTDSPTCNLIECENPTPKNGKANSTYLYYGSVIEITCHVGYHISGRPVTSCQADGTWTDSPTCNLIGCGIWEIAKGYFSAESGTTYGQTATQNCEVGYVLTGEDVVICVENGWNSNLASCNIVDCLAPTVANGIMSATTKPTTYNQTVEVACIGGYELLGNASVTCEADGNWTSLPQCTIQDEETSSALIAAYILVPVVLVAIVLTFLVIFWRHKVVRCLTTLCANKGQDENEQPRSGSLFTNVTYSGHHNDRQPNPDGEISEDSEYAIVTDDRNEKEQVEHSIYYNTVDAVDTKQETIEHNYDHTKSPATPVFNSTYSHVSGVTGNFESNYNTTPDPYPGKISFQTDEQTMDNSYNVLNIQNSKQSLGKPQQPNMQDDQESEYDHAKAGGTDQVDLNDYSHLQR